MRKWIFLLMTALTWPAAHVDAKTVNPVGAAPPVDTKPAKPVGAAPPVATKPVKPVGEVPRVVAKPVKPAGGAPPVAAKPARPANEAIVRNFVRAFNAHDIQAMMRFCAPDVRWMNIEADKLSSETTGDFKLDEAMRKYFKGTPSSHSELRGLIVSGPFVSTIEEANWVRAGKKRQQCSIGVYEISDSKIRNVWYFPAHDCRR